MIEVKNHVETMALKIINDAKAKRYKFNEKHLYKVNSDELDLICALLLKLNISVNVKEVTGDICDIEISFNTSNESPKLTYVVRDMGKLTEGDASPEDLNIDSEMSEEIDLCIKNINNCLAFNEE